MSTYDEIQRQFGKAVVAQQGEISVVDLLTEIRDDLRAMRKIAEASVQQPQFETKEEKVKRLLTKENKSELLNGGTIETPKHK